MREIYLVNLGLYSDLSSTEVELKFSKCKKRIETSLQILKETQNYLATKTVLDLTSENKILINTKVADIKYSENVSEKSDLTKAIQQFFSNTFDLINTELTFIHNNSTKIYFLEYNMFNDLWEKILLYSTNVLNKIDNVSYYDNEQETLQSVYIALFILLFGAYSVFFYILMNKIKKPKHELLMNFLKIRDFIISYYQVKCETFLIFLSAEEGGGDILNNSMEQDEDDDLNENDKTLLMEDNHRKAKEAEDDFSHKKKRKKAKYQKNSWGLFFLFFLFFGIVFAYFFLTTNLYGMLMKKINVNLYEFNSTCLTETYFYFGDNAQRLFKFIYLFENLLFF